MSDFSEPLDILAEQFNTLPGIGKKTAMRLAYFVLTQPLEYAQNFSSAVLRAKNSAKYCRICQNISGDEVCPICKNESRNHDIIMVVKSPKDVIALEKSHEYKGVYHVLHGVISPMDGVSPSDLKIRELLERVGGKENAEVVMALSPTIEGDATAMYLAGILKPLGVKVTRIAQGLPMGSDLEYADEATLLTAYNERREM